MKKILALMTIVTLSSLNVACVAPSSVDAGEEGVLIYQPWIFGHGGVDEEPLTTGLSWTVWSTSVERYNIKPQKYKEHFIDLTASDNVAIDFDAYVTLKIQKGKSPLLHEESGKNWYNNKIKDKYRMIVRNEERTHSSIDLRTNPEIIEQSQETIKKKLEDYIASINLPIVVTKVVIGKVVPPTEVLKEAADTAAQKQRTKTQAARAIAEKSRAEAETNKALADIAYSKEFGMTTEQFLRNKELDIMQQAVKQGSVSLIMNASNAQPMFTTGK